MIAALDFVFDTCTCLSPNQQQLTGDDALLRDCHGVDCTVLRLKLVEKGEVVAGLPDMDLVIRPTVEPDLDVRASTGTYHYMSLCPHSRLKWALGPNPLPTKRLVPADKVYLLTICKVDVYVQPNHKQLLCPWASSMRCST